MEKIRLSILIPVFNAEKYLRRCIESLLNQNKPIYEILLVNDGSTDKSGLLCDEYAAQYGNIRVVHKENGGNASARNVAIENATGDYLAWIDSDDFVDRNFVESIEKVIVECDPDCMCFGWRYIARGEAQPDAIPYLNHNTLLDREYIHSTILPPMLNIVDDHEGFIYAFVWNKVFKRKIFIENRIHFDESRRKWVDRSVVVEYLRFCETFYSLDKALYNYVQTVDSVSSKYYSHIFDVITANFRNYSKLYASEYDFDNQYSNNYWCCAIENMMLESLKQTKDCDSIHEKMLCVLADPQVQHWYAKRIPKDEWESKASQLVTEKKYSDAIALYQKKLTHSNRKEKKRELIYKAKRMIKILLGRN